VAAEDDGACVGERLREMSDDAGGSRLGVDFLDRVAGPAVRRLATEGVDPPAERRHRHVAGGGRERGDLGEAAAIGGLQDGVDRFAAVIAAEHIGALADGDGAEVGAHGRQAPDLAGGGAGDDRAARRRQRLDRIGADRRAAAEDQYLAAEHHRSGVVQRATQCARFV